MMEHGVEVKKEWILNDRDIANKKVDLDKYIKLPKSMPTAFICNCDLTASMFIQYLKAKGYNVPEDISVVGYDDFLYSEVSGIGITTYKVDMEEMVRRTLKRIMHILKGERYRGGLSIVEGYIVEKESVKELNKK